MLKISDSIAELVEVWMNWMNSNSLVNNTNLSLEVRRQSAVECEKLINREYELIADIDKVFEKCKIKNKI